MLYYTHAFCLTYGMGGGCVPKTGNNFSIQQTRGKIVPVVKLRHAKVVVVVDGIHGRNQWHTLIPVSHRLVVLYPRRLFGEV